MYYRPWKNVYLLDRAQCGRAADFDQALLKKSKLALDASSGKTSTFRIKINSIAGGILAMQ
jgi:hypothetical protein